jgi:xanthine dehydrogenase accessory factor
MMSACECKILIKGAGDLASGVALRLFRSGFPVAMTELPHPLMVRRTVSFGEAVNEGEAIVEGIMAKLVPDAPAMETALCDRCASRFIPVIVDPEAQCKLPIKPLVIIDAIMAKRNLGTRIGDAPFVVALGPGFVAGADCHAIVETNRGHNLGRVLYSGSAEPDTGIPGEIGGKTVERLLRSPADGILEGISEIGDRVQAGQVVAMVDGREVVSQIDGILRGLVRSGMSVTKGLKIGDVDPRAARDHCFLVSDKSLAIGGGVLEAVMARLASEAMRENGNRAISTRCR